MYRLNDRYRESEIGGNVMKQAQDLKQMLHQLDGQKYGAYKRLK